MIPVMLYYDIDAEQENQSPPAYHKGYYTQQRFSFYVYPFLNTKHNIYSYGRINTKWNSYLLTTNKHSKSS